MNYYYTSSGETPSIYVSESLLKELEENLTTLNELLKNISLKEIVNGFDFQIMNSEDVLWINIDSFCFDYILTNEDEETGNLIKFEHAIRSK